MDNPEVIASPDTKGVDPVVGHKTLADGKHEPLRKSEADALWASIEAEKARRLDL